jgi:hypothetical protein
MANSNNPTPISGYTLPVIHTFDTVVTGNGTITGDGYKLYGRSASSEMAQGLNAYASNASLWASTNLTLGGSLVSNVSSFASSLRTSFVSGLGSAALTLVPTTTAQTTRLEEMALAAKAILEDPEIDPTENGQLAAGLSAAMGGGHSAVPAIKDNITFEQKLKAKATALTAYAQALGEYFKLTNQAAVLAGGASENATKTAAVVPVVAPFESQLVSDIFANWQDSLNTGQVRDQQIRQTVVAGETVGTFGATLTYSPTTWNASEWNAEFTTAYLGIKSQAAAAKTI